MYREEQLTRSLDLTKIRVSQLMSELEAIKEANIIVLETKESVMRSLARQNSQLTVEVGVLITLPHSVLFILPRTAG